MVAVLAQAVVGEIFDSTNVLFCQVTAMCGHLTIIPSLSIMHIAEWRLA
jgi:hypothetical protein